MDGLDILSGIFRATYGVRVAFNPIASSIPKLEKELLSRLRHHVDESYVDRYDEHLKEVNFSQLQSGNRLCVLFKWKFPGYYDWNRNRYFDPREGTKKLLNFKAIFDDGRELSGNLVSIDGVLCNITFSEDISFFRKANILEVVSKSGPIKRK